MESPISGLQKLRELLTGEVESRSGHVTAFLVSPVETPELHVLIELDEDLFADEEQQAVNDEFAELEKRLREETIEEQSVDAVKRLAELEDRLRDPNRGILDD